MSEPFIIDAHAHLGSTGQLVCHEVSVAGVLSTMARLGVRLTVCSDHGALFEGGSTGLERLQLAYDASRGQIRGLAVFDPHAPRECLRELDGAIGWAGLAGIKIHPSCHATPADDPSYEPVWKYAAEHDLTILTHSWSVSDHNPSQALSTPDRFERWVKRFPQVRLVLGHAGGRGLGRLDAVRMANEHPGVYIDFAGDIYCYRLIETLVRTVPVEKILFGSDFPWTGVADHSTRVLLARIGDDVKARILCRNAARVYKLEVAPC